jgi:hypothetical protein
MQAKQQSEKSFAKNSNRAERSRTRTSARQNQLKLSHCMTHGATTAHFELHEAPRAVVMDPKCQLAERAALVKRFGTFCPQQARIADVLRTLVTFG